MFGKIRRLIRDSVKLWWANDPSSMGAALAYYALFSLAPFLLIMIAMAGLFVGRGIVEATIIQDIQAAVGPGPAQFVGDVLIELSKPASSFTAAIVGSVILIIGALGMLSQLQHSLRHLWSVRERKAGLISFIHHKLVAFVMILLLGLVFAVSLTLNTLIALFYPILEHFIPITAHLISYSTGVISFLVIVLIFILIYKYLPQATLSWRAAVGGAFVTGFLFAIGKWTIGFYLVHSSTASSYGAAGALIILITWIYYSAQVFFLGAAFTHVLDRKLARGMLG